MPELIADNKDFARVGIDLEDGDANIRINGRVVAYISREEGHLRVLDLSIDVVEQLKALDFAIVERGEKRRLKISAAGCDDF